MATNENYKGILQEMCQKRRDPVPVYSECISFLENGANAFSTDVKSIFKGATFVGTGKGKTKKEAEKNAAYCVIQQIYTTFPNEKGYEGGSSYSTMPTPDNSWRNPQSEKDRDRDRERDRGSDSRDRERERERDRGNDRDSHRERERDRGDPMFQSPTRHAPPIDRDASPPMSRSSIGSSNGVNPEIEKLRTALEQANKTFTDRYNSLEKKYSELKDYIDKKIKASRKSRKGERSPNTVITMREIEELPSARSGDDRKLSHVTLYRGMSALVPDQINYYLYRVVFSHGFKPKSYTHINKEYLFEGYLLYSAEMLHKPIIHIANSAGQHFGMTLIEVKPVTVSRVDFQKILTFHNFFFNKILSQTYLEYNSHNELYFVPEVKCLSEPTRDLFQVLMDLLRFEDISTELPDRLIGADEKEFRQYFEDRYLKRILLAPRGDFNVCREIDHTKKFVYNNSTGYTVTDMDGQPLDLKSGLCPTLLCTHTSASSGKEYWSLKPLLFFDKDGGGEDTSHWDLEQYSNPDSPRTTQPRDHEGEKAIEFEQYIRKSKLFAKDPMICKVFGITSEMHAIAKVAILVFLPEIKWWIKMEAFQRQIVSIENPRLLREVFTHPSSKTINSLVPAEYKLFKGFFPFVTDNQRLEFLGDSVLKFCSTIYLFFKFPRSMEGELTTKRSEITNNTYLLAKCDDWDVSDLLRYSSTEDIKKPKADVMEALFGAIFLEKGIGEAYSFIIKNIFKDPNDKFPKFQCNHSFETQLTKRQKDFLFGVHVQIQKTCLLEEATNCLSSDSNSYQRLEFLGDAFLDMVVSKYLYDTFPKEQEGFLSQARSLLVRNETLAAISTRINLHYAVTDPSVVFTPKRKGDLFESFVGCLLLDNGMDRTKPFIHEYLNLTPDYVLELLDAHYASSRPVPHNSSELLPPQPGEPVPINQIYDYTTPDIIATNPTTTITNDGEDVETTTNDQNLMQIDDASTTPGDQSEVDDKIDDGDDEQDEEGEVLMESSDEQIEELKEEIKSKI